MNSEDRHANIVAMLEGRTEAESNEEELQSVEEESDPSGAEEVEEKEEKEVFAANASDEDDEYEPEEGHRVPYGRFKQVNDNRRKLQAQIAEQERIIAEFNNKKSQETEESSYDYTYDDDDSDDFGDDGGELSYLRQQTQEMQVKFAAMELEKEIGAAMQDYPNVPEEYIWETIAQDGNLSASQVAAQYSNWVAEVEEAAIARHINNQGQGGASAPPRPSRKQTAQSNPGSDEDWKPRNTDEAREAMIAYLRS